MSVQARHPGTTITPGAGSAGPGFPVSGVIFEITQADLVLGVFTAVHNLNQAFMAWTLYADTSLVTMPDDATSVDANTFLVDLTNFQPIPGTWHLIVIG